MSASGEGRGRSGRWVAWSVLALYLVAIGTVFAWPNGGQIRWVQIRSWWWVKSHLWPSLTPEGWSTLINAALIAPVTAACVVLLPRVRWWIWLVLTVIGAAGIEIAQAEFLPGRDGAQLGDALANIAGGVVGIGIGWWVLRRQRSRAAAEPSEAPEDQSASSARSA